MKLIYMLGEDVRTVCVIGDNVDPIPEIQPELIYDDVAVMATGRSDYPNQINNVLAFPGIFRGALDCRATEITISMYLEAAKAIAALVEDQDLDREHIIPSVFDPRVSKAVANAVSSVNSNFSKQ